MEERKEAEDYGVTFNPEGNKDNVFASKYKGNHPCRGFGPSVLIGIHGRAESYRAGGKSGASMGMNIHTLLSKFGSTLVSEGITSLPKERETLLWKEGCPLYDEINPYSVKKKK